MIINSNKCVRLIVLIVLFIGCTTFKNQNNELKQKLKTLGLNQIERFKIIVILPMAGCSTCISDVEKYFIENVKNDKTTLLILTAFASKRSLTMSFGQEALEVSNALIDSDNLFNSGTFLSLYPKFIYLEDKIISRIEEVSPNNLDALSNYINSVK